MIKAAFFDVDGTLMSHKSRSIPQSARDAVARLRQAGIACFVATGRHMSEMEKLPMDDMVFDGYFTLNGQLVLDGNKKMRYGTPLTGPVKDYLVELFTQKRFPELLVEERDIYLNYSTELVDQVHQSLSTAPPEVGEYSGGEIYQVCLYLYPEQEAEFAHLAPECTITRWHFGGVDVIAKGGGKMEAIRRYLEEAELRPEEIIGFGDGENDADMLAFAGIGVAMGNGVDAVKAVADYVTDDIDADGIANALKHFGLI